MVKVFFSPFAWNKLKTTHCFICQVSHFDPNSGVEACEECQASSKFCRKKDFASTHPTPPPLPHRHYLPSDPTVASKRLSNNLSERRTDPLELRFFSGDLWKICKKKQDLLLKAFSGFSSRFPSHLNLKFSLWSSAVTLLYLLLLLEKIFPQLSQDILQGLTFLML